MTAKTKMYKMKMGILKRFKTAIRIITYSVITIFLFEQLVWAQGMPNQGFAPQIQIPDEPIQSRSIIDSLVIPEHIGKIKTVYEEPLSIDKKVILHIQDSHANYEAQMNIAKILEYIATLDTDTQKPLLIAVEGAKDKVDTSIINEIDSKNIRYMISNYFMENGLIDGAEFYSAMQDMKDVSDIIIWGVEDKEVYIENRDLFKRLYQIKPRTKNLLAGLNRNLTAKMEGDFTPEQLEFIAKLRAYHSDDIGLEEYAGYLRNQKPMPTGRQAVTRNQKSNYEMLIRLIELKDQINFERVEQERMDLIKELKGKLVKEELMEVISKGLYYQVGRITAKEYFRYLGTYIEKMIVDEEERAKNWKADNIGISDKYKNLINYIDYVKLESQIDRDSLFRELAQVEKETAQDMFSDAEDNLYYLQAKHLLIIEKFLELKIYREDLYYYKENRKDFLNLGGNPLRVFLATFERFCDLGIKRDEILVGNTLNKMEELGTDTAILITGGFHTEGITKLFEGRGISHLVISPRMTEMNDKSRYTDLMLEKKSTLDKILLFTGTRIKPAPVLENLLANIQTVLQIQHEILHYKDIFQNFVSNGKRLCQVERIIGGKQKYVLIAHENDFPEEIEDAKFYLDLTGNVVKVTILDKPYIEGTVEGTEIMPLDILRSTAVKAIAACIGALILVPLAFWVGDIVIKSGNLQVLLSAAVGIGAVFSKMDRREFIKFLAAIALFFKQILSLFGCGSGEEEREGEVLVSPDEWDKYVHEGDGGSKRLVADLGGKDLSKYEKLRIHDVKANMEDTKIIVQLISSNEISAYEGIYPIKFIIGTKSKTVELNLSEIDDNILKEVRYLVIQYGEYATFYDHETGEHEPQWLNDDFDREIEVGEVRGIGKAPSAPGEEDTEALANWLEERAIGPNTNVPGSFEVLDKDANKVWEEVNTVEGKEVNPIDAIIERMIIKEGASWYDIACSIIASLNADREPADIIDALLDILDRERLGEIELTAAKYREGDPAHPFKQEGLFFRLFPKNGKWLQEDPIYGDYYEGFPNNNNIHWEDWKPIAGENAWIVMMLMHIYAKTRSEKALRLAKKVADALIKLQAENGGIRMAPEGTWHERGTDFYYNEISTENNLSCYSVFRMLAGVTGEQKYRNVMDGIERYLKSAFDSNNKIFYQGMHYERDGWTTKDNTTFAVDCQTWAIAVLGPEVIDNWFGEGTAYEIWQKTKNLSKFYEKGGVGFSEDDVVSVEWTCGAILAVEILKDYYPSYEEELSGDLDIMNEKIASMRRDLGDDIATYPYADKRVRIPFGWNSPPVKVNSRTSTAWRLMNLIGKGINPFYLSESDIAAMQKDRREFLASFFNLFGKPFTSIILALLLTPALLLIPMVVNAGIGAGLSGFDVLGIAIFPIALGIFAVGGFNRRKFGGLGLFKTGIVALIMSLFLNACATGRVGDKTEISGYLKQEAAERFEKEADLTLRMGYGWSAADTLLEAYQMILKNEELMAKIRNAQPLREEYMVLQNFIRKAKEIKDLDELVKFYLYCKTNQDTIHIDNLDDVLEHYRSDIKKIEGGAQIIKDFKKLKKLEVVKVWEVLGVFYEKSDIVKILIAEKGYDIGRSVFNGIDVLDLKKNEIFPIPASGAPVNQFVSQWGGRAVEEEDSGSESRKGLGRVPIPPMSAVPYWSDLPESGWDEAIREENGRLIKYKSKRIKVLSNDRERADFFEIGIVQNHRYLDFYLRTDHPGARVTVELLSKDKRTTWTAGPYEINTPGKKVPLIIELDRFKNDKRESIGNISEASEIVLKYSETGNYGLEVYTSGSINTLQYLLERREKGEEVIFDVSEGNETSKLDMPWGKTLIFVIGAILGLPVLSEAGQITGSVAGASFGTGISSLDIIGILGLLALPFVAVMPPNKPNKSEIVSKLVTLYIPFVFVIVTVLSPDYGLWILSSAAIGLIMSQMLGAAKLRRFIHSILNKIGIGTAIMVLVISMACTSLINRHRERIYEPTTYHEGKGIPEKDHLQQQLMQEVQQYKNLTLGSKNTSTDILLNAYKTVIFKEQKGDIALIGEFQKLADFIIMIKSMNGDILLKLDKFWVVRKHPVNNLLNSLSKAERKKIIGIEGIEDTEPDYNFNLNQVIKDEFLERGIKEQGEKEPTFPKGKLSILPLSLIGISFLFDKAEASAAQVLPSAASGSIPASIIAAKLAIAVIIGYAIISAVLMGVRIWKSQRIREISQGDNGLRVVCTTMSFAMALGLMHCFISIVRPEIFVGPGHMLCTLLFVVFLVGFKYVIYTEVGSLKREKKDEDQGPRDSNGDKNNTGNSLRTIAPLLILVPALIFASPAVVNAAGIAGAVYSSVNIFGILSAVVLLSVVLVLGIRRKGGDEGPSVLLVKDEIVQIESPSDEFLKRIAKGIINGFGNEKISLTPKEVYPGILPSEGDINVLKHLTSEQIVTWVGLDETKKLQVERGVEELVSENIGIILRLYKAGTGSAMDERDTKKLKKYLTAIYNAKLTGNIVVIKTARPVVYDILALEELANGNKQFDKRVVKMNFDVFCRYGVACGTVPVIAKTKEVDVNTILEKLGIVGVEKHIVNLVGKEDKKAVLQNAINSLVGGKKVTLDRCYILTVRENEDFWGDLSKYAAVMVIGYEGYVISNIQSAAIREFLEIARSVGYMGDLREEIKAALMREGMEEETAEEAISKAAGVDYRKEHTGDAAEVIENTGKDLPTQL